MKFKDILKNKALLEKEAIFYSKYVGVQKTIAMPAPPTYEEFLKEEYFSIQWLGSIVLDEDDKKTIYFNSKSYKFDLPNTKENYYKCLDKLVELWRKE